MTHTKIPKLVTSLLPPVVLEIQNKRYAVFGGVWYEVSSKFTIDDAYKRWKRWEPGTKVQTKKVAGDRVWKVANSKGNGYYAVTHQNGSWSCTCPGYGFRRACRHIDETKKKIN